LEKEFMAGHLSLRSLKSTAVIKDTADTLAPERWNVVKEKERLDDELAEFHRTQLNRCKLIRQRANARAVDLYEKLLFKMRWANPPLPIRHRNVMVEYCEHLLGPDSHNPFASQNVLNSCNEIAAGTQLEKITLELKALCDKIESIANTRDSSIMERKSNLVTVTEKAIVKNEGKLRWMMENNLGRKDRYWTIWFLAGRAMIPELKRYIAAHPNEIDERDPDHGMTALHYACKQSNVEVVSTLTDSGANINARILSDGRTPLHLAAQYSTIEIVAHLLMLGVFFDARDTYGLRAIDVAYQNSNKATFDYLDHWNKLIPPLPPSTPPPEEDLSLIPEEYLTTTKDVFEAMSLKLQMLTKRIDGVSDGDGSNSSALHSMHSKMEPLMEMRLCEKHSLICIQEGFLMEGIKSLRRRWRVAKKMLAKSLVDAANDDNSSNQGNVEGNNVPRADTGTNASGLEAIATDAADTEPSKEETTLSVNGDVATEAPQGPIEVAASQAPAVAASSQGPTPSLETLMALALKGLTFTEPTTNETTSDVVDAANNKTMASPPTRKQRTNTAHVPPSPSRSQRTVAVTNTINPQTVATIGRDLVEVLIQHKFEGFALTVLCDIILCLSTHLDNYTRMCVFVRISECVLFLFDTINNQRRKTYKESSRTTFLPPSRRNYFSETSNNNTNTNATLNTLNNTASKANIDGTKKDAATEAKSTAFIVFNELVLPCTGAELTSASAMSTSKLIAQLVDEEEQEKINSIIDSSGNSVVESWTNNNNAGRNVDEGDNDDFSIHSTQLPMQVASAATPTEPAPVLQPLMQPPNQVRKQSSAQSLSPQSAAQSPMQFRRRDSVISSTLLSLLDDVNVGNASNIIASTDLTVDNVNAITSMQTASSPDQIKAQKLSELIQLGRLCANKALQLHHAIHSKKDIHGSIYASTATAAQPLLHAADAQGDDAISLVPLLELTSEMYERSQYVQQSQSAQAIGANIDTNDALHDAIDLLEYAEVVCTRILGFYHAETVRIMLTIVKLLLKCGNGDAYRAAAIKATDMSRRLDQLALTDPQRADVLGRKCAEVIALSKLLEQYSADDDAGNGEDEEEEGDEHTDGDTNSTSITSSLFGNSQGGDPSKKARSESAAAFISNIKNISTTFAASRSHYANHIRNAMVKEIRAEKRRQRRIQKTLRAKEAKEREQQLQQQQLQQRSNSVMISRSASVFSVGSRANNNNSGEKMTKESLAESVSIILNKQKQNAASTEDSSSTGGPQNTMDKIKEYQKEVEELQVNIR
jgi:hypothetical protein